MPQRENASNLDDMVIYQFPREGVFLPNYEKLNVYFSKLKPKGFETNNNIHA